MTDERPDPLKSRLLALSEEIVDLSDRLDKAEAGSDDRLAHTCVKRLRAIGDELVDHLEQAGGDDLAFAQFMMGSVCSLLGFWKQAESSYRRALETWPGHVGLLNELFDALVAQRKYDDAEPVIRESIRHGGETPLILRNLAAVLVHLKRINEAKLVMINCTARFPDDLESRSFLKQLDSPATSKKPIP
jgi:tetratricopeptide (TPR) repeat protein